MQAQCCGDEECQCIQVYNSPPPTIPANSPDIVVVSDDDSSVHLSPQVEITESEG